MAKIPYFAIPARMAEFEVVTRSGKVLCFRSLILLKMARRWAKERLLLTLQESQVQSWDNVGLGVSLCFSSILTS